LTMRALTAAISGPLHEDVGRLVEIREDMSMETEHPHDAALLRNVRRRVNRARNFPENTCSASRHLHLIAAELAAGRPCPMLREEPQHCAFTMLAVLEALWKARTELALLKTPNIARLSGPQRPAQEVDHETK
jgi:hypothetical protein